eukprot:m.36678 g.36678  ORF g.36678 m.36678 type:complete len:411 (-) comp17424_c0_seq1:76-1308(-)
MTQLLQLDPNPASSKLACQEHIGFDNLPDQLVRGLSNRENQYCLNLMVLGETCSGKSTLIESLFGDSFECIKSDDFKTGHGHRDVRMHCVQKILQDGPVKVHVSVNTCSGLGDQLDTGGSAQTPVNHVEAQFATKLEAELKAERDTQVKDPLVHACLYLLNPTGCEMKALDIRMLKQLHTWVNVVPVVAKADGLTSEEITRFKRVVKDTLTEHGINIYKPSASSLTSKKYEESFPLAVVASREVVQIDGVPTRVREYPWGVVQVENHEHSELSQLRDFLLRDETFALIQSTKSTKFNRYRETQLTKMGFVDVDSDGNTMGLLENLAVKTRQSLGETNQREAELRTKFVRMAKSKEVQINSSMEALSNKFERLKAIHKDEETKLRVLLEKKQLERSNWLEEQKGKKREKPR